jgi:hypothetical protein
MTLLTTTNDSILESIRSSTNALRHIMHLDVAGRSMMAFMRGHMVEIHAHQNAKEYYAEFYTSVGKEFIQYDDYSFVLHHCSRFLYLHWKEEIDRLRAGSLGSALNEIGGKLPEMREKPTTPTRRPGAVQGSWYGEVYKELSQGVLPKEHGVRNEVLKPEECVLQGAVGLDLIWAAFLVYACDVWARQIPFMWDLVREAIATRRLIEEQMSKEEVSKVVSARVEEYKVASLNFSKAFADWQEYHAATVDIHDPMFDRSVAGLFEWAGTLTTDFGSWTIKPILKDEMYRELASNILALRGEPTTVKIPDMEYWRKLQFAPPSNKIGAPGMPPFSLTSTAERQAAE